MRVVLDTVVSVRALFNPRSVWGQLARRTGEFELITSPEIAQEFAEVTTRSALQQRLARFAAHTEHAEVLGALRTAEVILDVPTVAVCRDSDDDKFFACAVAGRADYLVSEDEDVLAVAEYEGVRTIRTAAFLKLLDEAGQ
ncbi:MAG: putative toxin-antitoxin system toxin component, PIN family [Chloroflexota bacterium]|nr:putative toxin-antitoxin system toxin component, PIN family [Chloroflexota bacterium]